MLTELLESLTLAENDYRDASTRADDLRAVRNGLVKLAIGSGATHAQIATATGLSRGRVSQLVER